MKSNSLEKKQLNEINVIAQRYIILSATSDAQATALLEWWNSNHDDGHDSNGDDAS